MSLFLDSSPREHDPKSQARVTGCVEKNLRIFGINAFTSELNIRNLFLQRYNNCVIITMNLFNLFMESLKF